ncbi:MAG: hypothetical protein JW820_18725 [Spirochaetales bacterium]|nr:hypothetical protein [Spirochaetales bacterium]
MKDLAYYRRLQYELVWEPRDDEGDRYFKVCLREIPQVSSWGRTKVEAKGRLFEALDDFLEWRIAEGLSIPEADRPWVEPENVESLAFESQASRPTEWVTIPADAAEPWNNRKPITTTRDPMENLAGRIDFAEIPA